MTAGRSCCTTVNDSKLEFPRVSPGKRDFLNHAAKTYYGYLKDSAKAATYLKNRGITGEAARDFKLGYVKEPLENHDEMVGMLCIPFITPTGVSALRFRRIEGSGHKYHQELGTYTPLFNVRDLHRPETHIAFCEGELDGLVMSALVGVPSVAVAGLGQWVKNGKFYKRILQDYDRVFVCMDTDDKGEGQKTAGQILRTLPNGVNIKLPFDVNDTFLQYGREFILKELGLWEEYEQDESSGTQPSVLLAA